MCRLLLACYVLNKIKKSASHHVLFYAVYMCQKWSNYVGAFKCYKQNVSRYHCSWASLSTKRSFTPDSSRWLRCSGTAPIKHIEWAESADTARLVASFLPQHAAWPRKRWIRPDASRCWECLHRMCCVVLRCGAAPYTQSDATQRGTAQRIRCERTFTPRVHAWPSASWWLRLVIFLFTFFQSAIAVQIFDITPIYGTLQPGESEKVTLTFYGHANIGSEVCAVCEVDGGPSYEIKLKGEASLVNYKFDYLEIDYNKIVSRSSLGLALKRIHTKTYHSLYYDALRLWFCTSVISVCEPFL